jgi:hypothetical protein
VNYRRQNLVYLEEFQTVTVGAVGYRPRVPSATVDCGPSSARKSDSGCRKFELQEYKCSEGHSIGISTSPADQIGGTSVGYASTIDEVTKRNMPQRKQPVRLEDLAFRQCSNKYSRSCDRWISDLTAAIRKGEKAYVSVSERVLNECRALEKELSTTPTGILKFLSPSLVANFLERIDSYDSFVKYNYRNHRDSEGHLSVCTAVLLCVLNRSIERFHTHNTSYKFGKSKILQNLDRVPRLLELSSSSLGGHPKLVATAIGHVKHLQVFKYPKHCTDGIISQLRLHCPRLTEVDVSGSFEVTNGSAAHIMEMTGIKWLKLEGTRINDKNYGLIISKLPNIANIRLWFNENSVLFETGLEPIDTITHITGTFREMDAVSQMCPNTTNIRFRSFSFLMVAHIRYLSRLTAFNALRALNILCDFSHDFHWRDFLKGIGHRLQELTIEHCSGVNLQDIVTLCPSLLNFSLIGWPVFHLNTPLDPQLPHFRNLINLKVENTSLRPVDFRYIRYYINLETIHLSGVNIFTVEFLMEVICLGTLKKLEVFHVEESSPGALTVEALELLIGHCQLLKRIEGLSHCPNLNRSHIYDLKSQVLNQNFDLLIEE